MSTQIFHVTKHIVPGQYVRQYPHATLTGKSEGLRICLNQYVPLENLSPRPGDVTIVAAHANGVSKELYEPLWDELVTYIHRNTDVRVRGIWMADVASQGESGVLNEKLLGNDPSWLDHPRDLMHIINHFRDEMTQPIFGIGHSMGGQNIAQVALWHPRLFDAIILIDPVLYRRADEHPGKGAGYAPAVMSTFRRDIWPSREDAAAKFRQNAFYQSWDPRVLDLFIKYGLRDLPTAIYPSVPDDKDNTVDTSSIKKTPVTLTTSKHQEVFTFERPKFKLTGQDLSKHELVASTHPDIPSSVKPDAPFYRPEPVFTFAQMPHLRPRCLYIFASKSALSNPAARSDKLAQTGVGEGGNGGHTNIDPKWGAAVQNVLIQGAGHFVPFEKPLVVSEHLSEWIQIQMRRVRLEHEEERKQSEQMERSRGKGYMFDENFLFWMNKEAERILGKTFKL